MKAATITLAIVAVLGLAGLSSALGDTLSVALNDIAVITGTVRGKSVGRVVLRVPVPEQVLNARIDFAKLEFPAFLSDSSPAVVSVVVHDCLTPWQRAQVSWTVPWRRPGGDFDSLSRAWFIALPGDSHPAVLDITQTVRGWQQGKGRYGLFLKRPDAEGGGFLGERVRLREALAAARVKFYFTHVQD
jgi:hypothetical protein